MGHGAGVAGGRPPHSALPFPMTVMGMMQTSFRQEDNDNSQASATHRVFQIPVPDETSTETEGCIE